MGLTHLFATRGTCGTGLVLTSSLSFVNATMSGSLDALALSESDAKKMLAGRVHTGSPNVDFQMAQYIYKKNSSGVPIINIRKVWEKLLLAARAIVAIENPSDVFVLSARPYGQRAVLKFASYTGATPIAGRYTPGALTNQIQAAFREPRHCHPLQQQERPLYRTHVVAACPRGAGSAWKHHSQGPRLPPSGRALSIDLRLPGWRDRS